MTTGLEPDDRRGGPRHPHEAIAAWQEHVGDVVTAAQQAIAGREGQMDARRRLSAWQRAERTLLIRAEHAARRSSEEGRTGALLVHRSTWWRTRLTEHLTARAVPVLGEAEDGAEGLGLAVAEQPDLLVLEGRLPSFPTTEIVAQVRQFLPVTRCAVQVEHPDEIGPALSAGAAAVFTRRIAPKDVADALVRLLADPPSEPLVLR